MTVIYEREPAPKAEVYAVQFRQKRSLVWITQGRYYSTEEEAKIACDRSHEGSPELYWRVLKK